jgi:probable HAF family extracellular repeat protein
MRLRRVVKSSAYSFILALIALVPASAQVTYTVVPLPARLGLARLGSQSISNKNTVVGTTTVNGQSQGFVWRNNALMRLPSLGGTCTYADGISEPERIVGVSCLPGDGVKHATLWRGSQVIDLDSFGGSGSSALAINLQDNVVGGVTELDGSIRGYYWSNFNWSDLGDLGGSFTIALAINNSDIVVGQSDTSTVPDPRFHIPPFHGIQWQSGVLTDMGQIFGSDFNYATDINNAGVVSGAADLAGDQAAHAILWKNGSVQDLSTYTGDQVSWANGMNNVGDVVGSSGGVDHHQGDGPPVYAMQCPCRAVLWQNGQVIDLDRAIPHQWKLIYAIAINDQGEILARAWQPASEPVLLIPTSSHPARKLDGDAPMIPGTSSNSAQPQRLVRDREGKINWQF